MAALIIAAFFSVIIVGFTVGPPLIYLFSRPEPNSFVTTEEGEQEWLDESLSEFQSWEENLEDEPTL